MKVLISDNLHAKGVAIFENAPNIEVINRPGMPPEEFMEVVQDADGAGRTLRWFIEDVRGLFGDDFARHGAPLLPSERHNGDGTAARAGAETCGQGWPRPRRRTCRNGTRR